MQDAIQTATADFFVPVTVAWIVAFAGHELVRRRWPGAWPVDPPARTDHRWLDVALVFVVAAGILGLGQLWQRGHLRWEWPGAWAHAAFLLGQMLVWSPLFVVLALRGQGGASVWVTRRGLGRKLGLGFALGVAAVTAFLALRGELDRWPAIAASAVAPRSLAHAVPVFLEGVGVAFLFVRLRWALATPLAALLPGILFALAHVPGEVAGGRSPAHIAAFFAFNTAFVAAVLLALARTRDVVWLGVVHYLMDLAIDAF